MTPERWRQVNAAFAHALGLPADERRPYLERACAEDASLAAEVADLLAHDARALGEAFLTATCPGGVKSRLSAPAGAGQLIGKRLGPYEVRERVASGGMGDVYRAVRVDDYRQTVAVKVIRPGLAGDELRQRFRIERQVLAGLSHPNVVRLLDGGTTEDGLLYFVMEYIDGEPLDRWCARRQPALREQLELLLGVARAVGYAHQQGVIHRDLKPANVMVTADGVPKVTDFGLAKRLDQEEGPSAAGRTRTGVILGTVNYLAPEQAGGPAWAVGPAADVYALGAILYELLTGRPPFRGPTLLETLEQVRSAEPVPLSRLQPRLPRDLETVCLKALAKGPAGRYPTAAAFAADLERFLRGLPVQARPVGRLVKAARWCRRKPFAAGLAAALVLAVTAGFAGVTREWRRAEANFAEAERQRLLAEDSFHQAHQTVTGLVRINANDLLSGRPDLAPVRLLLEEETLKYYQNLLRQRGDDPTLRAEMADAYVRLGYLYHKDGQRRHLAAAAYRTALALYRDLVREHPERLTFRRQYAYTHLDFGQSLLDMGQAAEGNRSLEQASVLLAEHAAGQPDDREARLDLAQAYHSLGLFHHDSGRAAEALKWHHKARALAEKLVRDVPGDQRFRVVLARALYHVARDQDKTGHPAEALRAYEGSAALWERLAAETPLQAGFRRDLAACYHNLGNLHRDAGTLAEAVPCYRRALQVREQLSRDHPGHLASLSDAGGTGHRLGEALERLGRREEATAAFQRSVDQARALAEKAPGERAYRQLLTERCRNLARLYRDLGRPDRAAALTLQSKQLWPESPVQQARTAERRAGSSASGQTR